MNRNTTSISLAWFRRSLFEVIYNYIYCNFF